MSRIEVASDRWNILNNESMTLKRVPEADRTEQQRLRLQELDNLKEDIVAQVVEGDPLLGVLLRAMIAEGMVETIACDTIGSLREDDTSEQQTDDEQEID